MSENIRKPAVSGSFYPLNREELIEMIKGIEDKENSRIDKSMANNKIIGGIVPHAGYAYSGAHAIHFFKILQNNKQPIDTIVIINPNHSGAGPAIALDSHSSWDSPLGKVDIDQGLYAALDIKKSGMAHLDEHSGEVMIPFIKYYLPKNIKIAPISIFDQSYDSACDLAKQIDNAIKTTGKNIVIIASCDYSHFVNPDDGYKFDNMVCEKVQNLDTKGVYETITKMNISVCGYGPIMTLIEYSLINYSNIKTQILSRGHSGETSPSTRVVDYITTLFFENVK